LRELGRFEESEAEHRAVLELHRRTLGESHPDTLINRNGLALVLWESGQLAESEAEHRAVLDLRRQVLGAEHPDTLIAATTSRSSYGIPDVSPRPWTSTAPYSPSGGGPWARSTQPRS
jgi:hypothetical protein